MPNLNEIRATDFSFARISAQLLIDNNVHYVSRYLAWLPNGKVILPSEYADDKAHGVTVILNWETTATRPLFGAPAGNTDGAEANRQANALGAPVGGIEGHIVFSFDSDPNVLSTAQMDQIIAYGDAFASHGRPVGVYGGARLIDYIFARRGHAWFYWQTVAWSGSYLSPAADFYQRVGHSWRLPGVPDNAYDEDVVIHPGLVPLPPTPPPVIVPTKGKLMSADIVTGLVHTTSYGFSQFVGRLTVGQPIKSFTAVVHGPDPHFADPKSADDDWEFSRDATVRAQVRDNDIVVTVNAPNWKEGDPTPDVEVVAFV